MLDCAHAEQGNLPLSCSAGTGGALLPLRFRRAPPGLSFEELNLLFLRLLFIKWGSQAFRTLSLMYPIKDWVLFVLQQKSLWTSHCALQIKTTGILAVQRCRDSRGAQGKYDAWPQATLAGDKGELKTHHCLAGGGVGDPATSSCGGRKRSLNFLPLSGYFVPAQ